MKHDRSRRSLAERCCVGGAAAAGGRAGSPRRTDRVRTHASRSCVRTTATPSTSKPATSGTSSGIGRRGHVGLVRLDRLRAANGSGGSSTRRSGTRPRASTTGVAGGGRARQHRSTSRRTPSSSATRSTNTCRRCRAARECRSRRLGSSSRPWISTPGAGKAFEAALGAGQSTLQGETLWYRMVAGGPAPRYVRLRPRPSLSAILEGQRRAGAARTGQRSDREDDGRDPESAADDELRRRAQVVSGFNRTGVGSA